MLKGLLSSGDRIRTCDLRVMSPTSYHCSTPQYILKTFLLCFLKNDAKPKNGSVLQVQRYNKFIHSQTIGWQIEFKIVIL